MQLLVFLIALMMTCAVGVFSFRSYKNSLFAFWVQTGALVAIFFTLYAVYDAKELFSWGIFALISKFILIPAIILYVINSLNLQSEDEPVGGFFVSPIIAFTLSLAVSYALLGVFYQFSLIKEPFALLAANFIFMMGIFGFILRVSFIKQILSYCLFENGIHLLLALSAYDAHEVVELGIMTDAIFAVIIMSILVFRFNRVYGSLNITKATDLRG